MEVQRQLTAVTFSFALLLSACSTADDSQSEDSSSNGSSNAAVAVADLPDPCELIDQADAEDIFGTEVEAGKPGETPGSGGTTSGRSCTWNHASSTLSATIFVSTSYLVPADVCGWCEPIDGYGYEAWGGITDLGSGGGSLMIVAEDLGIQIEAYGPDVTIDQLETLAESLLAGPP
jgi:hypothetical protein